MSPSGNAQGCTFTEQTFAGGAIKVAGSCPAPAGGGIDDARLERHLYRDHDGNADPAEVDAGANTPAGDAAQHRGCPARLTGRRTGDCPAELTADAPCRAGHGACGVLAGCGGRRRMRRDAARHEVAAGSSRALEHRSRAAAGEVASEVTAVARRRSVGAPQRPAIDGAPAAPSRRSCVTAADGSAAGGRISFAQQRGRPLQLSRLLAARRPDARRRCAAPAGLARRRDRRRWTGAIARGAYELHHARWTRPRCRTAPTMAIEITHRGRRIGDARRSRAARRRSMMIGYVTFGTQRPRQGARLLRRLLGRSARRRMMEFGETGFTLYGTGVRPARPRRHQAL